MRARRILCASVLVAESLVVLLAVLVAKDLTDVPGPALVAAGGGGALACLLLAGLLRFRWAYLLGSALQVLLVLAGLVVPVMFFVGGLFALLWFLALHLAARIEREQRARGGLA